MEKSEVDLALRRPSETRSRSTPLSLLTAMLTTTLLAHLVGPACAFPVKSWYERRWEGVHRQETDASCGPASIVTLLQTYFGIAVEEADVFALAIAPLAGENAEPNPGALPIWTGTSLLGLRDALNALGFRSAGVRISFDDLLRYFDHVGLPVIAHMKLPERHFVVVVGKVGSDSLLVADPSSGRYVLHRSEAVQRLSGNILLYDPPSPVREDTIARHLHHATNTEQFALFLSERRRLP